MDKISDITTLRKEVLSATSPRLAEELLLVLWQKDPKAEQELRELVAGLNNDVLSAEEYEQARNIAISYHIPFSMDNKANEHIRGQKKVVSKIFLHKIYHKDIIAALMAISSHIVFNGWTYPHMDQLPAGLNEKDSYDVWRGKLINA